jgi:cell wall-associated NlpC family hydrolase
LTIATSLAKWNTNEELADELIRMASDNLGIGYRSGGTTKNGFDCSGLMYATFSSLDIKLPRSSHEMATIGTVIDVNQAQKGDLIFFKTRGGSQINHVGMVVEVNEGEIRFIHSATHGGVIISSTKEKYYEKNFTQINRVLQQ